MASIALYLLMTNAHTHVHRHKISWTPVPYVSLPIGHLHLNAPRTPDTQLVQNQTHYLIAFYSQFFFSSCYFLFLKEWHPHETNLLTRTRHLGIMSSFVLFSTLYQFLSPNPCDSVLNYSLICLLFSISTVIALVQNIIISQLDPCTRLLTGLVCLPPILFS